jgi:septum formation protein
MPAVSLPRLVLASASPRRVELLRGIGVEVLVRPARVDERTLPDEEPAEHVRRLAIAKARADARPGELVLGADTMVVLDGEFLGKPVGPGEAEAMLGRLAGREHRVFTGVALLEPDSGRLAARVSETAVWLAALSAEEIRRYVATGEPLDKAGAYAVQGLGSLFVERLEGDYGTVVGLPLAALPALFRELGHDLTDFTRAARRIADGPASKDMERRP